MVLKILCVNFVEQGEILHALQITGGLYHMIQGQTSRLQHRDHILQGLNGLGSHAVCQGTRIRDQTQLAGGKDQTACLNGLGIRPDCRWCFVGVQDFQTIRFLSLGVPSYFFGFYLPSGAQNPFEHGFQLFSRTLDGLLWGCQIQPDMGI